MNLESIRAAIAWFENQRDGYEEARKRAVANGAMSSTIKSAENIKAQIDTALACLRECAERRENKPLTVEELRVMDDPIWLASGDDSGWSFVWHKSNGDISIHDCYGNDYRLYESDYGITWIAYRHNLERSDT